MFLELAVNGQTVATAGGSEVATVQLRVFHDTRANSALVYLTGDRISDTGESERLEWFNQFIRSGDGVTVRLVTAGPSDTPKRVTPLAGPKKADAAADGSKIWCSFCGRSNDEVPRMIAGSGVYICSECVTVCEQASHSHP